jgi:hypothetical protein
MKSGAACLAAACALGLVEGGCGQSSEAGCGFGIAVPESLTTAVLMLSCPPTDLVSIQVSGPCNAGDGGLSSYVRGAQVLVASPIPGQCTVVLTFAGGFIYRTQLTFQADTVNLPGCNGAESTPYVGPTVNVLEVDNPTSTCLDAGSDASG